MSACRVMLLKAYRLSGARRAIAALALMPTRNQAINQSHEAIASIGGGISRIAIVGACYGCACGEPERELADSSSAARERPASPARKQQNGRIAILLATIGLFAASAVPAHAQSDWTGGFSSNWFLAGNWLNGFPRQTTDGTIDTVTPNSTVIATPGAAARFLQVGQNGTGLLTIQTGGTLSDSSGFVGNLSGSVGTVTVTGAGSSWANSGTLLVGGMGRGTLTIQDGGTLSSDGGSVGQSPGSNGTVMVTGAGSTWTNGVSSTGLTIGGFGTGTLTIANGGQVANLTSGNAANIGNGPGSQGSVLVTGAGSSWTNAPGLNIGNSGTGTLTIADGGVVTGLGPTVIAANAGAIGTLNIGAGAGNPAAAPGTLNASSVAFGAGTGTINFNHTSTSYVFAPTITGAGTVNVLAGTTTLTGANTYTGGTTIAGGTLQLGNGGTSGSILGDVTDNGTLAFNRSDTVTFRGVISGSGNLAQLGPGTTILTAANSYSGGTNLNGGTLGVGNNPALGTGNLAMAAGTTLQFAAANLSLANTISMTGDPTFDTMGNNATVSGVISGAGATLEKNGAGSLSLTAINTYTGPTNINAGTLAIGGGGSIATSSGVKLTAAGTDVRSLRWRQSNHRRFERRHRIGGDARRQHAFAQHHQFDGFRRRDLRHRRVDQDRCRHADPDRRQHLHRRHDDRRRHAATGQWRHLGSASSAMSPTTARWPLTAATRSPSLG